MAAIERCQWPELGPRYDVALHEAVRYVLGRFAVHGIIVAGSIVAGNPGPSSDLDLYVVHARPQRQRIQRWFGDVPAEIFVNSPAMIRRYFVEERNRPITAAMFVNGFVILDEAPVVEELRREAAEWLARPVDVAEGELTMQRYLAADAYDNAKDVAEHSPAEATRILNSAVNDMLRYSFLANGRRLPREKAFLSALAAVDSDLGDLAQRYFLAADMPTRLALVEQIALRSIGATGFFAWESTPEDAPEEPGAPTN